MRAARGHAVIACGLAMAVAGGCDAIAPVVVATAPVNACPLHPCVPATTLGGSYAQAGATPSCVAGTCVVAGQVNDLLLVIGFAEDSFFAPGHTYVTTLERTPQVGPCAIPNCSPPICPLPPWALDANTHLIERSAALDVGWYLGNATETALPVEATYRPLLGPTMLDAIDLGLPLDPVQGLTVNAGGSDAFPGPNGGAALGFEAYLQPGCYERTLQPYAPLSTAFPPEIKPWTPAQFGPDSVTDFDRTKEETGLPMGTTPATVPTFDIARAEGLDGWTAYLRSIGTGRIFSNVAPLSGSLAENVILATNHVPDGAEALTGLELVVEPPAGTPMPREVFAPAGTPLSQELPAHEAYPSLPLPVALTGRVETALGTPVPAGIVFTATDIFDRSGQAYPPNFEFSTQTSTTTDARTGASTYSVTLPQGRYAIAVRPTDASSAVTMSARSIGGAAGATGSGDLSVVSLVAVAGQALVYDGRALSDAVVEVVPTECAATGNPDAGAADASTTQSIALPQTSANCIPRPAQTNTAPDGSFVLALDPGGYVLRVRPIDGSNLPWVNQPLLIVSGSGPVTLDPIWIPAPIDVGMSLTAGTNPITNATVRVFTDPTGGGRAVELGRAITDSDGKYEMFISPATQ